MNGNTHYLSTDSGQLAAVIDQQMALIQQQERLINELNLKTYQQGVEISGLKTQVNQQANNGVFFQIREASMQEQFGQQVGMLRAECSSLRHELTQQTAMLNVERASSLQALEKQAAVFRAESASILTRLNDQAEKFERERTSLQRDVGLYREVCKAQDDALRKAENQNAELKRKIEELLKEKAEQSAPAVSSAASAPSLVAWDATLRGTLITPPVETAPGEEEAPAPRNSGVEESNYCSNDPIDGDIGNEYDHLLGDLDETLRNSSKRLRA